MGYSGIKAREPCRDCQYFGTKNDASLISDLLPEYPRIEAWCSDVGCNRLKERAYSVYDGGNYNSLPPELRQFIKPPENNGKRRFSLGLR